MGSIDNSNTALNGVSLSVKDGTNSSSSRPEPVLTELFSENITAKILRTADKLLIGNNPPKNYPEVAPQKGDGAGRYRSRGIDFWTCGFFPGCIYSLLERAIKHPSSIKQNVLPLPALRQKLEFVGKTWSDPIHGEAYLTNTHDLGFIMLPHMRPRWELLHDESALRTIITAAESLHTRFNPKIGAIRCWDELVWQKAPMTHITGMNDNFIVIIDSMCNLDLLFYAAAQSGKTYLADAARTHALTLLKSHVRAEPARDRSGYDGMLYSSGHVVNFDPADGRIKEKRTAQGYTKDSTWSRGQAWAILGYAQTYAWTGQPEFLDVACGLIEYFMLRMEEAPRSVEIRTANGKMAGRYVPVWDFDAPLEQEPPLRDTSAGAAAANGMLILAQTLAGQGRYGLSARYLDAALKIVEDTLAYSLAEERAKLVVGSDGQLAGVDEKEGQTFESVLKNATVSNNGDGYFTIKDHGLVYADYFLIEFGTRLLRMGLA